MFSSFSLVPISPLPLQHCIFPHQFLSIPSELALQVAVFRNFRAHRRQDAEAPPLDLILWRKANSITQSQDGALSYEGNPPTKQHLQHRRCLISCLFCKDQVELMRLSEVSSRFMEKLVESWEEPEYLLTFCFLHICFWESSQFEKKESQLSQLSKQV